MVLLRVYARYLYVPTMILGINAVALYLMAHGYHYLCLALPILAGIGLSFLMEHVLPYEEEWNQAHDDVAKDLAHGMVYELGNLITLGLLLLISLALPQATVWPASLPFLVQ